MITEQYWQQSRWVKNSFAELEGDIVVYHPFNGQTLKLDDLLKELFIALSSASTITSLFTHPPISHYLSSLSPEEQRQYLDRSLRELARNELVERYEPENVTG